jgi:hypothetical protein
LLDHGRQSDAPYKNSTAMMNPFSGMLGDYQVIMAIPAATTASSSGTDRSSIWWQSPNWHGFTFALFSPDRTVRATATPSAASPTARETIHSGGFSTCSDGASNAVSVSGTYDESS